MIEVSNVSFDRSEEFSLFIVAGGYESRSSYLAKLDVRADVRAAVKLPRVQGASYDDNWAFLNGAGWVSIAPESVPSWLREFLASRAASPSISIAVDISSMPRHLLGVLLEHFNEYGDGLRVTFLYCPAWFEASSQQAKLDVALSAQPVGPYFAGAVRPPHLPIGLVVGLGLEPHRSDGLREFLEPGRLWAFVAQGLDERFVSSVLEVNEYFLRGTGIEVLRYDIRDVADTFRALRSMCAAAAFVYRVVLAPSGPKVFTLACLLAGVARDVDRPAVWRIGAVGDPDVAVDVEPTGEVVACSVRFFNPTGPVGPVGEGANFPVATGKPPPLS